MGGLATRRRLAACVLVGALALVLPQSVLAAPRVEVVVGLAQPSLVQFAEGQRSLQGYGHARRVLASAFGSRLYLGRLATEQAQAARRIERAVPGARVRRHYSTVLDGLSVLLRPGQVAALRHVAGVTGVYPSLRYHALTDTVPEVIGAPTVWGSTLAGQGQGVKVAVIDDGIDVRHPFFAARGLTAPAGYPRGNRTYTNGKIIVARAFAPAGSSRRDRLPFDANVSRHGTHVAGILAGDQGLVAPGEPGRPRVAGLSGVAPRVWLGNYRGLSIPDPTYGSIGSTVDLVAAVDAAVRDQMDVINLSIGGTEIDPHADALVRAVQGAVAAGVVVVIAAGNERESLGYGSVDSPGASSSAITVAATTSSRFFARPASVSGTGTVPDVLQGFGVAAPDTGRRPRRIEGRLVSALVDGDARLCRRRAGMGFRDRIVVAESGGCSVLQKARVALAAGATTLVVSPTDAGPPQPVVDDTALPVLIAPDPSVAALLAYLSTGARARLEVRVNLHEVRTLPGVVASFSSAGPTPFDQILKPDVAAPGVAILSSVPDSSSNEPGDWAVFDGTSMSTPVVAGAAALLLQAHPDWTPADVKAALMATARPAYVDAAGTREASPLAAGAGLVDVAAADDPGVVTDPSSITFGAIADGGTSSLDLGVRDLGGGSGDWTVAARFVGLAPAGVTLSLPPLVSVPAGGSASIAVQAAVSADAPAKEGVGVIELVQGTRTRRIPFWLRVDRPRFATKPARALRIGRAVSSSTAGAGNRVSTYRYPTNPSPLGLPASYDGPEQLWHFHVPAGAVNAGVTIETARGVVAYPILMTARDESRVAGQSGLPLNVGPLDSDSSIVPAAGLDFPSRGEWWVSVESPPREAGRYRIKLWIDDRTPPRITVLGQRHEHGRLVLRLRIVDTGSGVNPGGVTMSGGGVPHRSVEFDPATGIATVDLQRLRPGRHQLRIQAPDLAETKDVLSASARPSNVATRVIRVTVPR